MLPEIDFYAIWGANLLPVANQNPLKIDAKRPSILGFNLSLIFHRFFEKNRRKIMQKAWKPALCTKIDEKSRLERRFLAKNRFLVNFWAPPGSPGASRDDPENS